MSCSTHETIESNAKTTGTTATSNERRVLIPTCGTAACASPLTFGVPNKPMVPTATTSPVHYPLPSRRRHIGQPLGSKATGKRVDSHE